MSGFPLGWDGISMRKRVTNANVGASQKPIRGVGKSDTSIASRVGNRVALVSDYQNVVELRRVSRVDVVVDGERRAIREMQRVEGAT